MTSYDSPASLARWQNVAAAPRGVRKAMKAPEIERMLRRAEAVRVRKADIEAEQRAMVREMRSAGVSWAAIGWFLGVTAEAGRQRYGGDAP